jgi:hypothetical protein
MMDDGAAMMNDNNGRFDWRLDRADRHRVWRDRRRFGSANDRAEPQGAGDKAISDAFQHQKIFK